MADTEHMDEDKRCTLFDKPQRFCVAHGDFHPIDEWGEHCERYEGASPIRKCNVCGGWHPLNAWGHNCMPEPNWNRSDHPAPMLISDNLPDIMNPLTGNPISSKSELRKQYKAAGVEETGGERVKKVERTEREIERDVAMSVKQTLETLKSDNVSNDQMANMLRAPAPENALGISIQ